MMSKKDMTTVSFSHNGKTTKPMLVSDFAKVAKKIKKMSREELLQLLERAKKK